MTIDRVGDALHGPIVAAHKAILFAYLDDHARLLTGYRWVTAEDTLRAEAALRAGITSRGVPGAVYVDYADLRVMPTSASRPWWQAVSGLRLSA